MLALLSLAPEQDLLRSVVALHEDHLALGDHMPFPQCSIFRLHQAIRSSAAYLVQQQRCQTLIKTAGAQQHLRLTVLLQGVTVKSVDLALREEVTPEISYTLLDVGLLAMMHRGVEELFGRVADLQNAHHSLLFHMSMRHQLNDQYRHLWRGRRWMCANSLGRTPP